MKGYSLGRVAQYARYHYVSQYKNYISLCLSIVGSLVMFGMLSRDMDTVFGIAMALYLLGGLAYARSTTFSLRDRGTKIMESVIPVSNEERFTVMLFNLVVVFPVSLALLSTVAMVVVSLFDYDGNLLLSLKELFEDGFIDWSVYVLSQMVCAVSLLINLLARRNLFVAYLITIIGSITFFTILARIGVELLVNVNEDMVRINIVEIPEWVGITILCLIPVVIYAFAYVALRKRQMKW